MVSVILATNPQRKTVSQPPLLPAEADEEGSDVVGITCQMEGRWSKAVPARSAALPRTTSTCLMWCAIALGALVRGIPCTHVGGLTTKMEQEWLSAVKNTCVARNLHGILVYAAVTLSIPSSSKHHVFREAFT